MEKFLLLGENEKFLLGSPCPIVRLNAKPFAHREKQKNNLML